MELLALLGFLGLPAGWVVSKYAKEEMKQGKHWLVLLRSLLLGSIASAAFYPEAGVASLVFVPIGLLASPLLQHLDIVVVFSLLFMRSDVVMASLVFLWGLPMGSLRRQS